MIGVWLMFVGILMMFGIIADINEGD